MSRVIRSEEATIELQSSDEAYHTEIDAGKPLFSTT
jgi:hypothetical protein